MRRIIIIITFLLFLLFVEFPEGALEVGEALGLPLGGALGGGGSGRRGRGGGGGLMVGVLSGGVDVPEALPLLLVVGHKLRRRRVTPVGGGAAGSPFRIRRRSPVAPRLAPLSCAVRLFALACFPVPFGFLLQVRHAHWFHQSVLWPPVLFLLCDLFRPIINGLFGTFFHYLQLNYFLFFA